MEGFMESFIYLLITVVILVLSMKKKKQVELPDDEQEERPDDPFRDLFGPDEDEAEQNYGYSEQEVELRRREAMEQEVDSRLETSREQEELNPWVTSEEANQMTMDADAIIKEASENNPISELGVLKEDDAYEIGLSDDQDISFDLKKAVIYSEIIEKRTF